VVSAASPPVPAHHNTIGIPQGCQQTNHSVSTMDDQLDSQTSAAHERLIPKALHSEFSAFNHKSVATPRPLQIKRPEADTRSAGGVNHRTKKISKSKGRRPTQNLSSKQTMRALNLKLQYALASGNLQASALNSTLPMCGFSAPKVIRSSGLVTDNPGRFITCV
jgi:hypothetical protein